MQKYRLIRTGQQDVEFTGQLLACVSSRQNNAPRWTELSLYRTDSGKYVYHSSGKTVVPGETDRGGVDVFVSPGDIMIFVCQEDGNGGFFVSALAKRLINELVTRFPDDFGGLDVTEKI